MVATHQGQPTLDGQPNRFPGACAICSTHVARFAGVLRGSRGDYTVRCSAHANAPGGGSNAGAPANAAPAGERPHCSARTALASVAMLRHAMRPTSPDDARETMLELATLAVWASGSADARRALAAATGEATTPAKRSAFVEGTNESVRDGAPSDDRPRGVGADLVGEILDRTSGSIAPSQAEPDRVLVRSGGEDAGWISPVQTGTGSASAQGESAHAETVGERLDRVREKRLAQARELLPLLSPAQRRGLAVCVSLVDAGHGCGVTDRVLLRCELLRRVVGRRGGTNTVPTDLGREVARLIAEEVGHGISGDRRPSAPPRERAAARGSRWAHLKKQ